ncbi:axoneme-associated protein mst101(2)-like [Leguminivora glycinivorella]|uniref:axoneme-associated protein mst101(2)-like n=1 Tax=Leguminivora glycinivorella TaxID=1035111 RepID=UPI0020105DE3|nr:axoneme-associated protein mst101(2)-like [Leguminivora glycinivorella]
MMDNTDPRRAKPPLDGPGPRGVPDCYYTSRVLDSTYRYVKFVRKLRAEEEEQRKGKENKLKELKDQQYSDFFISCDRKQFVRKLRTEEEEQRKGKENKLKELKDQQYSDFFISCDRKSLLNNVARRVELCMESYEADLAKKRQRLKELYTEEEEENIRKFVAQVQAGREAAWQAKKERLAYLIAKRKKEHADKYKDTPLSKCVHVMPCLVKLRAMEAQDIQLYQMKEKAARREAEKELDKMWYNLAMKESDALAARMEYDAIQRARLDMACHRYSMYQVEQNKIKEAQEKEKLRKETLYFRGLWDKAIKDEEEAERRRSEARHKTGHDRAQAIEERKLNLEKQAHEQQVIQDAWASLGEQGLAQVKAEEELRRRKENARDSANDDLIQEDAARFQKVLDEKRCQYLGWSQKTNRDVRKAMINQILDRKQAKEELQKKLLEQDEYHQQLFNQLLQLAAHKDLTDAQKRKQHQQNLLKQIEYNKLLKERALQEEQEQRKKCQRAAKEYDEEISRMLCRPFYSDMQHPFLRKMASGLTMREKCPCSRPDYCAVPEKKPVKE